MGAGQLFCLTRERYPSRQNRQKSSL